MTFIGNVDRKDDGTFLTKEDLSWRGIRWSGSSEDERNRKRFFFFTSRTITTPLFRRDTRNLHCSVLQAYTAGRKGKYQREKGP